MPKANWGETVSHVLDNMHPGPVLVVQMASVASTEWPALSVCWMRRGVLSPSTRATKEEHGGHTKVQEHFNWYDTCKRIMVSTKKATLNDSMTATTPDSPANYT